MPLTFAIAIYVVLWWTVLFAVLPIGVRTQAEDGTVVPGTPESAPKAPRLLRGRQVRPHRSRGAAGAAIGGRARGHDTRRIAGFALILRQRYGRAPANRQAIAEEQTGGSRKTKSSKARALLDLYVVFFFVLRFLFFLREPDLNARPYLASSPQTWAFCRAPCEAGRLLPFFSPRAHIS
jgi:hypothetical protein